MIAPPESGSAARSLLDCPEPLVAPGLLGRPRVRRTDDRFAARGLTAVESCSGPPAPASQRRRGRADLMAVTSRPPGDAPASRPRSMPRRSA
ncbi:hypothetical protein PV392_20880 [Streptomyces sp. ME03-5709C]|nr:hypothetical protein [Streptomyces sp. ME03-5709C]